MPTNLLITLTPPVFPDGYCPQSEQQRANDIASGMGAQIPGNYTVFNYGDTEPSADDRDKPWLRTDGGFIDGWYVYFGGQWTRPHPVPPSGGERRMFVGTEAEVWAYDGGDGNDPDTDAPQFAFGAMWEVDHDFDGRIPIGPGTPDGWGSAIGEGANAGTSRVTLTTAMLPEHRHFVSHSSQSNVPGIDANETVAYRGGGENNENYALSGVDATASPANVGLTSPVGEASDSDAAKRVATLPPVRGVWIIKRTARVAILPT